MEFQKTQVEDVEDYPSLIVRTSSTLVGGIASKGEIPRESAPKKSFVEKEEKSTVLSQNLNDLRSESLLLDKELGEGSFGKVYLGTYEGQKVAVKMSKEKLSGKESEAFEWEVSRLSVLSHPNLVRFYGVTKIKGSVSLVMEYCGGGSLQKLLSDNKDLSWSRRWELAIEIARGLAYLHQQGVLHRDLKADNVLIDDSGQVKLADLGISQIDAALNETELQAVTYVKYPRLLSPEEYDKGPQGESSASDMFAYGLLLWQIVTGKKPFENFGAGLDKAVIRGLREEIPDECPAAFASLIKKCWAKEAIKRPTAEMVVKELEAVASQFHPAPVASLLTQRVEVLVEEHRKEFVYYSEPYTTSDPIDEAPDTYWQRWEKESKKDKGEEKTTLPKEEKNISPPKDTPQPLGSEMERFLKNTDIPVSVLVGEGGLGKSLSTFIFAERLLREAVRASSEEKEDVEKSAAPSQTYLPIFLRPGISPWTVSQLKQGIRTALTSKVYGLNETAIETLKKTPVLIIVDGIDELQQDINIPNLPEALGLSEWPKAKLVFTSRRQVGQQTITPIELHQWLSHHGKYQACYLLPFKLEQMFSYLEKRLHWSQILKQQYEARLQEAPSLRAALRNPFVLQLFVQSFETLSKKDFKTLTRREIYEGFIVHWLDTHHTLLPLEVVTQLKTLPTQVAASEETSSLSSPKLSQPTLSDTETKSEEDTSHEPLTLVESFHAFAEAVASLFYQQNTLIAEESFLQTVLQISVKEKKESLPWLRLSSLVETASRATYAKARAVQVGGKRRAILSESDYLQLKQNNLTNFMRLNPLKFREGKASYIHKSFFEYFLSEWIVHQCEATRNEEMLATFLNLRSLQEEPGIVEFTVEGLQADKNTFRAEPDWAAGVLVNPAQMALLSLIKQSVYPSPFHQAAGNAITLLNRASVSFSGMHFPKLHAENADGSYGVFRGMNAEESRLLNFNVTGSDLSEMNFKGATLQFILGEKPALELEGPIHTLAYSNDGRLMAVGCHDKNIYLFDVKTLSLLHTFEGHEGKVLSIAFSPDDKLLASSGEDNTVRLWDIATQKHLHTFKGHTGPVQSVVFSPQGDRLASGSHDKTIRVWEIATLKHLCTFEGHLWPIQNIAFSPHGTTLASGSEDNTVRHWDIATQKHLHTFEGHTGPVQSVTFSPEGDRLASGSFDKTIRVWDIITYKHLSTLDGHTGPVQSVAFSPEGGRLASGGFDKTIRVWDMTKYKLFQIFEGHTSEIMRVIFSPQGKTLASGSNDKTVRFWDIQTHPSHRTFEGHTGDITSVAFSSQGDLLASGSTDETVRLWSIKNQKLLHTFEGHTGSVQSVIFSPKESILASGSFDKTVRVWDVVTYKALHMFEGHTDFVWNVTFSSQGKLLASGSNDKTIRLCDMEARKHLHTFEGHTWSVQSIAFSPHDTTLASGSRDGTIRLWNVEVATRPNLSIVEEKTSSPLQSVAFSSQALTSQSEDNTIQLLDTEESALHETLHTFEGHLSDITSVTFSPQGDLLASGSFDKTIRLWEMTTYKHLHTFEGHTHAVRNVAFSPEGNILASGSVDKTVRVWDIPTRQCLKVIGGFTGSINSLAFKQTSTQLFLATGSGDKAVRLFECIKGSSFYTLLRWTTNQSALSAFETNFTDAHLDETSARLLKQRGSMGKPAKIEEIPDEKQAHDPPSSTTLEAPRSRAAFFYQKEKPSQPASQSQENSQGLLL